MSPELFDSSCAGVIVGGLPPHGHVGHRRVDVEDPLVIEAHEHACRDHLARRCDQRGSVGVELAPVLLVHDSIFLIDHDQAGTVQPLPATKAPTIGPIAEKS
jgi:hypothetical protein